jgi:hypothetical protein
MAVRRRSRRRRSRPAFSLLWFSDAWFRAFILLGALVIAVRLEGMRIRNRRPDWGM